MAYVLGIDIGTTSTIGIILHIEDGICAIKSRPVALYSDKAGWAEENPRQWWENLCSLVPELLATANIAAADIHAIGVTGMLPATVLLDRDGRVLRRSIQQSDGRTGQEVQDILAEIAESDFIRIAGNGINQQLIATRIRWLEKHEPAIFAQIDTVFGSYDYINWCLTGEKTVEQNWALEAGFVDVASHTLSPKLIELAHLPTTAVPRKIGSAEIVGVVSEEAAHQTGLKAGTPVVGGAADHIASAFAAGVVNAGDVLLKFGGAADIMVATEQFTPDARMFMDYHLIPELFMPNGCMSTGGSALNWFIQEFAKSETEQAKAQGISPHQYLDQLAAKTVAGADGVIFIPYLLGEKTPIHDAMARGILSGMSLHHKMEHVWRALLEGYGYAFLHHCKVFNDIGYATTHFLASDGGSNSRLWMQICADILQSPIQLLHGHPGSCLGAAWAAVIGSGLSSRWQDVSRFITYGDLIEPNPEHATIYAQGYRRFRDLYESERRLRDADL